ncbi:hypothetical protein RB195_006153 [Necator americanus]|uniref:Uncharacterized protein n=1 Tax=Necator americanus TaxID=51031 RepID=A0ABR1BR71_NECAM
MNLLFLFLPLVMAKRQFPQAPGMYPPEEMKNDVPKVPRNPYQMSMLEDAGVIENYQFYYEKDVKELKPPGSGDKRGSFISDLNSGSTPLHGSSQVPKKSLYINESPRSPGSSQPGKTPLTNKVTSYNDGPKVNRPSSLVDSGHFGQPEAYYEEGGGKGPIPPHRTGTSDSPTGRGLIKSYGGRTSDATTGKGPIPPEGAGALGSASGEINEYVGWTPLPSHKSALVHRGDTKTGYEDLNEPPAISHDIKPPAVPEPERDNNEVIDPYITQTPKKYEGALARSKPSSDVETNTSGKGGGGSPAARPTWKSNELKEAVGMDEFPLQELDNDDREQHLHIGTGPSDKESERGYGGGSRSKLSGREELTNRNGHAGNSGATIVVGKKELPTISISMYTKSAENHEMPEKTLKTSTRTKYDSFLMTRGLPGDDRDILKKDSRCCPCCRDPMDRSGVATQKHSGGRVAGRSESNNPLQRQQHEVAPSRSSNIFADDLRKLSKLGDMLESPSFQKSRSGVPEVKTEVVREVHVLRASDPEVLIPTPTNGISSERAVRVEPRIRDRIMESSDIIPSSHGPTSTITLQRSASPLSPSVPGGQYVSPLTPPTSASFVPPQHFVPAVPQSYPPSIGYPTAGAGCPCAPPPPPPCCAPVQPCCMPSIPCCPPPPPVQCCPQPPVCCQPPPACCPPPVFCCSVPVIPTCFRACPACPCRRRLHAALRMKRSPGLHSRQCQSCTAAGQPKYATRVKRQAHCKACSSNPLISLFTSAPGSSSCSSCKRSDSRSARVKRMATTCKKVIKVFQGCLPCGKRKKRDIEEEYHRRVKRLGCLPCLGRKKRSPIQTNCKQCSNLGQVLYRFKRTIGCSPCGRKKRETKENNKSNPASCPCLSNHTRTFLLGRKKRAVDSEFDSMYTCDKSCCDYDRCHEIRAQSLHSFSGSVQRN